MTISVDLQLPIASKEMGVQVSMTSGDAVALVGELSALVKDGDATPLLSAFKDAITSKLSNL